MFLSNLIVKIDKWLTNAETLKELIGTSTINQAESEAAEDQSKKLEILKARESIKEDDESYYAKQCYLS
jgi:hypothetical protein